MAFSQSHNIKLAFGSDKFGKCKDCCSGQAAKLELGPDWLMCISTATLGRLLTPEPASSLLKWGIGHAY